ncbi:membrane protein [Pokkaliibacter plantistimulans]|uniref:Membrane protein n=3 Tax=Pseudomonadota TaxID=1224 RepID=A0ABX5LPU4_9GAMM|nr:flavohemoglobin expression-modulating QEGLA motif protein [Pokkaliibacter plantistimulans]PXF28676.1 membrane protein [Pokkaliibacter plantistimulans]
MKAYHETVRQLSDRIVKAQEPIRILDAIKWDDRIESAFFASKCKELPLVDIDYYQGRPLSFDPDSKRDEFYEIERDIARRLGNFNPLGRIMRRICREYRLVSTMLENRGKPAFGRISQELYGTASEVFHAGDPTLADLGRMMDATLTKLSASDVIQDEDKTINAEQAAKQLDERLNAKFNDTQVRVLLDDNIVADAAAGSDYLKIRRDAMFNQRDIDILFVHEGMVHLGTTLNGQRQSICTFLSKGPPSSTITQEGLAILMEVIAFVSYPTRLRKLANRIQAVDLVENGADFIDIYQFFVKQGFSEKTSYTNATRVFRGSTPTGKPFTKDLSYTKGFVMLYNFLQLAVQKGNLNAIQMLFCGKTNLEDIKVLTQLAEEGLVQAPVFLPDQLRDMSALSAWMCFSNFLNHLTLDRVESDYAALL